VATLTGGWSVCSDVVGLVDDVEAYDSGGYKGPYLSPYLPVPRGNYRNSNSFTFTPLEFIGENNSNRVLGGWASGWGMTVPGLLGQQP
jgi:hypothetical protein